MEKMTDSVQIILILCITYVVVTLINKRTAPKKDGTQQKGGVKQ